MRVALLTVATVSLAEGSQTFQYTPRELSFTDSSYFNQQPADPLQCPSNFYNVKAEGTSTEKYAFCDTQDAAASYLEDWTTKAKSTTTCSMDWSISCRKVKRKFTWNQANAHCKARGQRLCTAGELAETAPSDCHGVSYGRAWTSSPCGETGGKQYRFLAPADRVAAEAYAKDEQGFTGAWDRVSCVDASDTGAKKRFKCCAENRPPPTVLFGVQSCKSCPPDSASPGGVAPTLADDQDVCVCNEGRTKGDVGKCRFNTIAPTAPTAATNYPTSSPSQFPTSSPTPEDWSICPESSKYECRRLKGTCVWSNNDGCSAVPATKECGNREFAVGSALDCETLDWRINTFAGTNGNGAPVCHSSKSSDGRWFSSAATFDDAQGQCAEVGARLCSAEETRAAYTMDSRTVHGAKRYSWTDEVCGSFTDPATGKEHFRYVAVKAHKNDMNKCMWKAGDKATVRCCADSKKNGASSYCQSCDSRYAFTRVTGGWSDCSCASDDQKYDTRTLHTAQTAETCAPKNNINDPYVVTCPADTFRFASNSEDSATCADLIEDFKPKRTNKRLGVCAFSRTREVPDGKSRGTCFQETTYDQAKDICTNNGGRLCESSELSAGVSNDVGCDHNYEFVWTSTTCENGKVVQKGSGSLARRKGGKKCVDEVSSTETAHVRCCANINPPTCKKCPKNSESAEGSEGPEDCECSSGFYVNDRGECRPNSESSAPTSAPTPEFRCNTADQYPVVSSSTCADLGWTGSQGQLSGFPAETCGSARVNGRCHTRMSFERSEDICKSYGARSCTLDELMSGLGGVPGGADMSGCNQNYFYWSTKPCGGSVFNGNNQPLKRYPERRWTVRSDGALRCEKATAIRQARPICCASEVPENRCESCPAGTTVASGVARELGDCVCDAADMEFSDQSHIASACEKRPTKAPTESPTELPTGSPTTAPIPPTTAQPTASPTTAQPTVPCSFPETVTKQCFGLSEQSNGDASAAACEQECCSDNACLLWQWQAGGMGCWVGGSAQASAACTGPDTWSGGRRVAP